MVKHVRLYDKNTVGEIKWPDTELGMQAKSILLPLVQESVEKYVANVKTRFFLLEIDDVILPLTVNEKEYQNSYVVSNYYAVKGMEEWFSKIKRPIQLFKRPAVWTLGKFLQWAKINQIVMVNNWLFSTNPYPSLTAEQVTAIAKFLQNTFPQHVHIFRGINTLNGGELYTALKGEAYHLIGIRQVYIYDPQEKEKLSSKVHYHHRRDLKLMETHGYTIVRKKDLTPNDLERLLDLYRQIYIGKYTSYSPSYTCSFLENALKDDAIDFVGLKKEGRIDGIMGLRILNGIMTVPFFGYAREVPQSVGLYRIMSVLVIKEAEARKVVLNDSSGASAPKQFRGLRPHQEYIAVYDRHLPFNQRLFWTGAGMIINKIVSPLVKKLEKK